jgi:hypothetical protein
MAEKQAIDFYAISFYLFLPCLIGEQYGNDARRISSYPPRCLLSSGRMKPRGKYETD